MTRGVDEDETRESKQAITTTKTRDQRYDPEAIDQDADCHGEPRQARAVRTHTGSFAAEDGMRRISLAVGLVARIVYKHQFHQQESAWPEV